MATAIALTGDRRSKATILTTGAPSRTEELERELLEAASFAQGEGKHAAVVGFLKGLAKLAASDAEITFHRGRPVLKRVHEAIGASPYERSIHFHAEHRALLAHWAPRFRAKAYQQHKPVRAKLPGVAEESTDVPVDVLVKAMREAAATLEPSIRLDILNHLIRVAETTRTLPRYGPSVNYRAIRRDAGCTERQGQGNHAIGQLVLDWAGFFHRSEEVVTVARGVRRSRSVGEDRIRNYLAELQARPVTPENLHLQYAAPNMGNRPPSPSFGAAAEATNLPVPTVRNRPCSALLRADAAARGLREVWPGQNVATKAILDARRAELIAEVEKLAAAGETLVAKPGNRKSIDHDALVRRVGKPGLSLDNDEPFWRMVRNTGIKVVPWAPKSFVQFDYEHVSEASSEERSKDLKDANSRKSTKSRTRKAVLLYRDFMARKLELPVGCNRPIGDDFQETKLEFEAILDEIAENDAFGGTRSTFMTSIRWVRDWVVGQRDDDGLGEDFNLALRTAVQRDTRELKTIAGLADVTESCLQFWTRGESWPNDENRAAVSRLETVLGLEQGRLTRTLDDGGSWVRGQNVERKLPRRVRPHAPDDWKRMSDEEFAEFVEYVDAWLLHRSTAHGAVSRAAAKRRVAEEVRQRELGEDAVGLSQRLQEELKELVEHMTKPFGTTLNRRPGVTWEEKTTAIMKVNRLIEFAKWQIRPSQEGGLGRMADDLTLADLLHPPLVFAFVDYKARLNEDVVWQDQKRGKLFTSADVNFLITSATLVAQDYGFVTQHHDWAPRITTDVRSLPTFAHVSASGAQLGEETKEEEARESSPADSGEPIMPADLVALNQGDFLKQARRAELRYRQAQADLELIADGARDPMEPIQPIIDHTEPLLVLMTQLYKGAEREPNKARHELQFHLHRRDTLINRLFALTALRSTNIRELMFDGGGPNLVFDPFRQEWLLKIHWRCFKNYKSVPLFGRTRYREWYRKYLPDENGLTELITQYVKETRPWLLDNLPASATRPDHLFFSQGGREIQPWGMWDIVFKYTAKHVAHNRYLGIGIPGVQPFGPHAYRDIRATDILLHPCEKDAYLEAANALQTSPAMVAAHYGRVRSEVRNAVSDRRFLEVSERAKTAALRLR